MEMQQLHQQRINLEQNISSIGESFAATVEAMKNNLKEVNRLLLLHANNINVDKIKLAESIMDFGEWARGGEDRKSVMDDAIMQLTTGLPIRKDYCDLWVTYFGTKNYAHWSGQRSDHTYGYGPKHGSTCFSVGLKRAVRDRKPQHLMPDEVDACLYYLMNIERIQAASKAA
jgi:hypothetical protein